MDKIHVIRAVRGKLLTDDMLTLAGLLIKAGYTVRIVTQTKPDKKTKETVIQYWEGAQNE